MYHSVFLMRNRVALIASAVAVAFMASSAEAQDITKCARTLAKEAAKVERKRAKGMRKCFDAALKDGTPDPVCPDVDNAAKIADAESKMQAKVTDACTSVTLGDLGFTGLVSRCVGGTNDTGLCASDGDCPGAGVCTAQDECPDFYNGNLAASCSAPLTSPSDIGTCLICNGSNAVLAPIGIAYGHTVAPLPSIEAEPKDVLKCQRNVGKSTAKYYDKVRKALAKCKDATLKAGSGSCPDATANTAIAAALGKYQEKVAKDCVAATYPNGVDRADILEAIAFPVGVPARIPGVDTFNNYRDAISETIEQITQCSSELSTGDLAAGCQPLCGNGKIDAGETCDDGNQVDGDACPNNCSIVSCTDGGDVSATVTFTPPAGVTLTAVQVLVGYPEDKIRIPGSANQAQVLNRITVTDPIAALSANDLNYAVRLLVNTDGSTAIAGGPSLLSVDFDTCTGAPAVTDGDFACVVQATSAFGAVADPVFATTCSVDVP